MIIRWVLASLSVLGRLHWVDKEKLTNFILACQVENMRALLKNVDGEMLKTNPGHRNGRIC